MRVVLLHHLFDDDERKLTAKGWDIVVREGGSPIPTEGEIIELAHKADGLVTFLTDKITSRVLDNLPHLRIIANCAVGYDNIDVDYATQKGIMVTNTPDVLTNAVAEYTWGLILALVRHIPEADRFTRAGKFDGWQLDLFLGDELAGKTLGIVGAGRIGTAVGLKAPAFQMSLLYYDKQRNVKLESIGARNCNLHELLQASDIVTLHLPLTRETYHIIGEAELSVMKPTAYLINTARGPIIDEDALINCLTTNCIKGAALDVYEYEPHVPKALRELPNVLLLPHIGSATHKARQLMSHATVTNLIAGLEGKTPPNLINPSVLKR